MIGISQIGVAIPEYFLSLEELAKTRKIPPEYATKGLGVFESRIPYKITIEELAKRALEKINYKDVERFYIGTESDPDLSKPFSVKIINQKLGLSKVPFQYKFACLGGLQALLSACEYSFSHSGKPAVVLAVDRSIYSEKDKRAEITQGCAAVALRIEKSPSILALDFKNIGQFASDIDDFKVPAFSFPFPIVNGELTKIAFLECQKKALENWKENNKKFLKGKSVIEKFDYFIFHTPFPKMVEWLGALFWRHEKLSNKKNRLKLQHCIKKPELFKEYKKEIDKVRKLPEFQKFFAQKIKPSLKYHRFIGNSYTCSVFLALLGVLENTKKGKKIGILGYGSGAGAICLSAISLINNFKTDLEDQIKKGKKLTFKDYENWRKKYVC